MALIEGLELGMDQTILLLALALVLIAIQLYFGKKGKAKLGLQLLAVPFVLSIIAAAYAFFFMDFPDGGRVITAISYFIRLNVITIMLAAIYSLYFGKKR
ncbi:hypothetical protein MmiEs2_05110 [Methanimicrococcus stummii]|uniref:Uncharacterized protein n=1 Tax=Methanimicrococcus stummii TaxID=3028294 RepID=A0AA96ZY02_9EURY|nr:hypothetical protein [Methanimicrococcus sp. Es2]WNY28326.1 hypothetical protein MmiEs2_05110 [Methanimicrococcus sp. Es2]